MINEAYALVVGPCVACKTTISFNPNAVPSICVDGERKPLCRSCFARWNQIHRVSQGLPPEKLNPNAYEPCSEHQL